jgi:hypothetical protein
MADIHHFSQRISYRYVARKGVARLVTPGTRNRWRGTTITTQEAEGVEDHVEGDERSQMLDTALVMRSTFLKHAGLLEEA